MWQLLTHDPKNMTADTPTLNTVYIRALCTSK